MVHLLYKKNPKNATPIALQNILYLHIVIVLSFLSFFMQTEILRRRTFAIISHPDAGKTTLTEKFLLYGGAVQEAGSVTARKNPRTTGIARSTASHRR